MRLVYATILTMLLGAATTPAWAASACKVRVNKRTGAIDVSAAAVAANPRWGGSSSTATGTFYDAGTCVVAGSVVKCHLGPSGSLAERTPPATCQICVADDGPDVCCVYPKACVPGIRLRDASFAADDPRFESLAAPDGATLQVVGMNLQIVDGSGDTAGPPNGRGNLIVGYNEDTLGPANDRTGSHNLIVGPEHTYSSFGGVVFGYRNWLSGPNAAVTGGQNNEASGLASTVTGGTANWAAAQFASVSGGANNQATGDSASVSGGWHNQATAQQASVTGGYSNQATGTAASVSGGENNTASGVGSSVTAGALNTALGEGASVAGGEGNQATGAGALVGGGHNNVASGDSSAVTGGEGNTAQGQNSSVTGGYSNIAQGYDSSVTGGRSNLASGFAGSVSGGRSNEANGTDAVVSGGVCNIAGSGSRQTCPSSTTGGPTVSGGLNNLASADQATVSGGRYNAATAIQSTVGGGFDVLSTNQDDWDAGQSPAYHSDF